MTINAETLDQILADLIKAYDDPAQRDTLRNYLADAYADNGDADAEACQRWMAENHKRPYTSMQDPVAFALFDDSAVKPEEQLGDDESQFPGWLYKALEGHAKQIARHKLWPTGLKPLEENATEDAKKKWKEEAQAALVEHGRKVERAILAAWKSVPVDRRFDPPAEEKTEKQS